MNKSQMHAPSHLQCVVVHIDHAFTDRQGTAVSASHVHKASVRVVDYEVELEVFDQICCMSQIFRCLGERTLQNSISASFVASVGNVEMPYSVLAILVRSRKPDALARTEKRRACL